MFATIAIILLALLLIAGLNTASSANSANLKSGTLAFTNHYLSNSTTYKRNAHMMTVSGLLLPLADTSGGVYAGRFIDADIVTDANAQTNAIRGRCTPPHVDPYQQFVAAAADATWMNILVSASNDYTVVKAATATNDVCVGRVVAVLSATLLLVDTRDHAAQPAPA